MFLSVLLTGPQSPRGAPTVDRYGWRTNRASLHSGRRARQRREGGYGFVEQQKKKSSLQRPRTPSRPTLAALSASLKVKQTRGPSRSENPPPHCASRAGSGTGLPFRIRAGTGSLRMG
ncbi:hypothetical protein NDU88_003111 [Pleurodeles waltl]|uniref:Uncharacterized protein n=1 Tax=Pleurodeles waltl TaxID=8319 RepID=A0AAV7SG28_PLEWA|nr:hypothetical protein NDU88_003111 [Pleurodeles waltl]